MVFDCHNLLPYLVVFQLCFFCNACTDLEIKNNVDLLSEDFFQSDEDYVRFISPAYINLRSFANINSILALQEISSDEMCVPVRGNDWYEGGHWLRLHRHQWAPEDPSVTNTWNFLFQGVNECNRLLKLLEELDPSTAVIYSAELRGLRAIYYLWLMDLYGNVPLITSYDQVQSPTNASRKDLFNFIIFELNETKDDLSKTVSPITYGRVNYFVAETALASIHLNAETYTGTPNWAQVILHCDKIIQSNQYQLELDYFQCFIENNTDSKEIIFAIPYEDYNAPGFNLSMFTLNAASQKTFNLKSQPWNGWCTLSDFFATYEDQDVRKGDGVSKGSFLYGQQYDINGDTLLEDSSGISAPIDPDGLPLDYTPSIRSLDSAYSQDGARISKFEIAAGSSQDMNNDFPLYRYAQILLMKAEALWRLGRTNEALTLFNQIRQRSGLNAIDQLDEDIWIEELGREFFMEGHRRTDLIRFSKFKNEWWEKPASEECKNIFPIPRSQLEAGSNLNQNPCY